MSTIVFLGSLGNDPENNVTPNGHENLRFRAAVNTGHGANANTTWYSVTAWSGTAKGLTTLAERGLLAKGARVVVTGTLTGREYQDRNGQTRMSLDVSAHDVQLVSPPKGATAGTEPGRDAPSDADYASTPF